MLLNYVVIRCFLTGFHKDKRCQVGAELKESVARKASNKEGMESKGFPKKINMSMITVTEKSLKETEVFASFPPWHFTGPRRPVQRDCAVYSYQ